MFLFYSYSGIATLLAVILTLKYLTVKDNKTNEKLLRTWYSAIFYLIRIVFGTCSFIAPFTFSYYGQLLCLFTIICLIPYKDFMLIDMLYNYAASQIYSNVPYFIKNNIMPYVSKYVERGNEFLLLQLENIIPSYISTAQCNSFVFNNLCESIDVLKKAAGKNFKTTERVVDITQSLRPARADD